MNAQRGFALIAAALTLAVLAGVALLLITEGAMTQAQSASDAERARLRYLTEAGVARARWELAQTTSCNGYPTVTGAAFGADSYDVAIAPKEGSPVAVTVTGKLANGVTRVADFGGLVAYQAPELLNLQMGGTSGQDTMIDASVPNRNYGRDNSMFVNAVSPDQRALLKFDLTGYPTGTHVVSATLELRQWSVVTPGLAHIHRLTRSWVEGTGGGGSPDGATWNSHDGTATWTSAGGDYAPASAASTMVALEDNGGWAAWDVTGLVRDWVSGAVPNHGLLIRGETPLSKANFGSRDQNPGDAPKLTIGYACECGTTCAGSVGRLLLVVANAASPSTGVVLRRGLIESWGFAVTLIDDDATQASFDAALADNDVAYVAADVDDATLGDKLVDTATGVVIELGEQLDELGFSGDVMYKNRDEIEVLDNGHYVTEPFALGPLTFQTSLQSVPLVTSFEAPGMQTLAEALNVGSGYKPSLVVLEAGAELAGGGDAAGRRAKLPWGAAGFDISHLTDAGRTIMRRAIEWAAEPPPMVTLPIAHWTFDEGAGSTAADSVGGNDATLVGGPTWVAGTLNDAIDFDGSDDRVVTDADFTPPPIGTVTFWMQVPGAPGSVGRILGMADDWEIRHEAPGSPDVPPSTLAFDFGVSGTNTGFFSATAFDEPGRWYHVAAAYDTTTEAYAVYVDGVLEVSGTYPSDLTVPGPGILSIGTRTGSGENFEGTLDDVRVYDTMLGAAEIAALAAEGGGGGGGGPPPAGVVLEGYSEAFLPADAKSLTVATPAGTGDGDLLIATVITDGEQKPPMSAPAGWTLIDHGDQSKEVTMDVWWKLAGVAEPGSYDFSWSKSQQAYGVILRFSGHDPADPIDASASTGGSSNSPLSPAVVSSVANAAILRIGGFDEDDINVGDPGLSGHTAIYMNRSSADAESTSGGAGYLIQPSAGNSGTSTFFLTAVEEYRTVTIAIKPGAGP